MSKFQLAQINIAYGFETLDHPVMQDFSNAIDDINALAETSPGFVWRWASGENDDSGERLFNNPKVIINLSVRDSIDALKNDVYTSGHLDILKRKKEWFEKPSSAHLAMWWIPEGQYHSLEQAKSKLDSIDQYGATEQAFNFAKQFPRP